MKKKRKGSKGGERDKRSTRTENNKIAIVSCYLLTITLNVNGLNSQIKREWLNGENNRVSPLQMNLQVANFQKCKSISFTCPIT